MMLVDFDKIEETSSPNFFGGEKEYRSRVFIDDYGKIVKGRLIPGASIGLHTHEVNYEVMYFIEGEATVIYNGEKMKFTPGGVHYCAKGQSHTIINEGSEDVVFFAVLPNSP